MQSDKEGFLGCDQVSKFQISQVLLEFFSAMVAENVVACYKLVNNNNNLNLKKIFKQRLSFLTRRKDYIIDAAKA